MKNVLLVAIGILISLNILANVKDSLYAEYNTIRNRKFLDFRNDQSLKEIFHLIRDADSLGLTELEYNVWYNLLQKLLALRQGELVRTVTSESEMFTLLEDSCKTKVDNAFIKSYSYSFHYFFEPKENELGIKFAKEALSWSKICNSPKLMNNYVRCAESWMRVDPDSALSYAREGYDKFPMPTMERLLGRIYRAKGMHDLEVYYLEKAYASVSKNLSYEQVLTDWKHPLGVAYRNVGQLDKALEIFNEVRGIRHQDVFKGLVIPNINIGRLYFSMGELETAKDYLNEAVLVADSINAKYHFNEAIDVLIDIELELGDYKKAFELKRLLWTREKYDNFINADFGDLLREYLYQYKKRKIERNEEILSNLNDQLKVWLYLLLAIIFIGIVLYLLKRAWYEKRRISNRLLMNRMDQLNNQFSNHFIFNSLGAIHSAAINREFELCNKGILSLGKLLRIGLEGANNFLITLKDELTFISEYVNLYSLRNERQVDLRVKMNGFEPENLVVITGLIQPFVENTILHAYKNLEDVVIDLEVEKRGEQLDIVIADKGCGFDYEKLDFKKSFGISNVLNRITIINECRKGTLGLTINTKENEGTQVILTLSQNSKDLQFLANLFTS